MIGSEAWRCLQVLDIEKAKVYGLDGLTYLDKVRPLLCQAPMKQHAVRARSAALPKGEHIAPTRWPRATQVYDLIVVSLVAWLDSKTPGRPNP